MASERTTEALERIADALERIADVAEWRRDRKMKIVQAKARQRVSRSLRSDHLSPAGMHEARVRAEAVQKAKAGID